MVRISLSLVVVHLAVVFLFVTGGAAEPLCLSDAVRMALQRSPEVRMAEEGLKVAKAGQMHALSLWLPRLDFEESYLRADQPVAVFGSLLNQGRFSAALLDPVADPTLAALNHPDGVDNFRTRFSVTQPLFMGGELYYSQKMSKGEARAVQWDVEDSRAMIGFATIQAYWALSLARENVRVAEGAVFAAEKNLQEIELLYKEGTVVRSDLLSAKVQVADFRDQLVSAKGELRIAEKQLGIHVGSPEAGSWEVAALCLSGQGEQPDLDPASLLEVAKQKRPVYLALKEREMAAENAVKASRGRFLPRLGLDASYEWNAPGFADDLQGAYIVGVGFQWNLFRGLANLAEFRESVGRQAAVRYERRSLEDRITMEIERAVEEVRTNWERLEVTRERVGFAEESLRIILQRYREGMTTVVELEQAELALARSRLAWYRAIHDLRVAKARLGLATGSLLVAQEEGVCP